MLASTLTRGASQVDRSTLGTTDLVGLKIPLSVMIAVMSAAGVMSNAGFHTFIPTGAVRVPCHEATSLASRCSMGIARRWAWQDRG